MHREGYISLPVRAEGYYMLPVRADAGYVYCGACRGIFIAPNRLFPPLRKIDLNYIEAHTRSTDSGWAHAVGDGSPVEHHALNHLVPIKIGDN
jgi:hypothetical protein